MNNSINLILPKDKEFVRRQKKGKVLNGIAIVFPILIGIVSLVVFLITQAINPTAIRKQQDETVNEIAKLQDKKIKFFIVKDRLQNIDGILKKRINFAENINNLLSKAISGVSLVDLDINSKQVALTLSSPSLKSLDEFINSLILMVEKKDTIRSLKLESLTFNEKENEYLISLSSDL